VSSKTLFFILFYLVGFQVFSSLDLYGIKNLMYIFYPQDEEMILNFDYGVLDASTDFTFFRTGGIYYNPNLQGQYIVGLLLIFLISSANKTSRFLKNIFYFLSFFSVLLTGSRTSFVIITLIFLFNIPLKYKLYIFLFLGILSTYVFISFGPNALRIFNVISDLKDSEGSSNVKLNLLLEHINNSLNSLIGFMKLMIGNLWDGKLHLDSDIGYIIYAFGFIGLLFMVLYFFSYWNVIKNKFIYFYLLYSFTATIIFNFKLIFVWFLIFTMAFSRENCLNNTVRQSNE
jgi:hypothetical protein